MEVCKICSSLAYTPYTPPWIWFGTSQIQEQMVQNLQCHTDHFLSGTVYRITL